MSLALPDAPASHLGRREPTTPQPRATTIVARGLRKRYSGGAEVLRGVDLTIAAGEMVGLVGPSGTGKTTLLRLVGGAIRPTAGTLTAFGHDVAQLRGAALRAHRRRVATVAQQHGLVPRASVLHNVLLGRLGTQPLWRAAVEAVWPGTVAKATIRRIVGELGLPPVLDQPVDLLSGGQQQRVAVARALYQDGEVLLADEPVASVDQETAHLILHRLRRYAVDEGHAVLVSLHQRDLALRYCTRLLTLAGGTVAYDGPPDGAAWRASAREDAPLAAPEGSAIGAVNPTATSPATSPATMLIARHRTPPQAAGSTYAVVRPDDGAPAQPQGDARGQ